MQEFREEPLYKPSAEKILVYTDERKSTDIVFRQPPVKEPVYSEKMIQNVFN